MLSLPAQAGRLTMDLGGGGTDCDDRRPGPCASRLFGPYMAGGGGDSGGWAPAESSLCVGGGYVLSRAADVADGPRYLFDHIPPRLAPSSDDRDLLGLPAASEDDLWTVPTADDPLCQPAGTLPPATTAASTPTGLFGPDHKRVDLGEVAPSRVSVSVGGCSRLEPATAAAAAAEQRRPLHHSGGGLCVSEPTADSPEPDACLPAIEIGLPPSCPPSCSGSIKLQISVPCNRAATVSVHMPHVQHVQHVPATCGPCAAPASPLPPPLRPCCGPTFGPVAVVADAPADAVLEDEMAILARATSHLKESGWYYGMLSWQEAQECLRGTARGTFLVRDSFDRRFLFALTVQTAQGPTSVRVQFVRGRFRLDAPAALLEGMPTFSNVNSLVEHYARHGHVLYDQKGRPLLKMRLTRPLLREPPSLQHCCRLALNAAAAAAADGPLPLLPDRLRRYVQQYPFCR